MNNAVNIAALTISPPCRLVNQKPNIANPQRRIYDSDKNVIKRALDKCSYDYTIYPEIDMTGRLHYHGIVNIGRIEDWKGKTLPRLKALGFVCVKMNPNDKWIDYCTKEWEQTRNILNIRKPLMAAMTKDINQQMMDLRQQIHAHAHAMDP